MNRRPGEIVDKFYPRITNPRLTESERRKAFMAAMTLAYELGWEACEDEISVAWFKATGTVLNLQKHD